MIRRHRILLLAALLAVSLLLGGCIKPDPDKYSPVTDEGSSEALTEPISDPWVEPDTAAGETDTDEFPNLPEDGYTKRY